MNKEILKETFRAWKKAAKANYAITYPDSLGDCMSCVNYALAEKYGEESKGIFLKEWRHGMNGGSDVEYLKSVYIAHDITPEQAKVFYDVFGEHYKVFPKEYAPARCFQLFEKDMPVYIVSYTYTGFDGKEYRAEDRYTDIEKAAKRFGDLFNSEDYRNVHIKSAE